MYQALWVPRTNSTTGSKAVAVKVMTRVAAGTLGMKYNDELIRSREEAMRVLEIAKRYRKYNPVLHPLEISFHHCLTYVSVLYYHLIIFVGVVKRWLTRSSKCMGLRKDRCPPKSPPSSRCSQERKLLEW